MSIDKNKELILNRVYSNKTIDEVPVTDGAVTIDKDNKDLYIDFEDERIKISDIIFVYDLPTMGIFNKIYYTSRYRAFWIYYNNASESKWIKLTNLDKPVYKLESEFELENDTNLAYVNVGSLIDITERGSHFRGTVIGCIVIDKNNSYGIITERTDSIGGPCHVRILFNNNLENKLTNCDIYLDSNYAGNDKMGTFNKPFTTLKEIEDYRVNSTDGTNLLLTNNSYKTTIHVKSNSKISYNNEENENIEIRNWNNVFICCDEFIVNKVNDFNNITIKKSKDIYFINLQFNIKNYMTLIDATNIIFKNNNIIALNGLYISLFEVNGSTILFDDVDFNNTNIYVSDLCNLTFKNCNNIIFDDTEHVQSDGYIIIDNCSNTQFNKSHNYNTFDFYSINDSEFQNLQCVTRGNIQLQSGYLTDRLNDIVLNASNIDLGQFDFKGLPYDRLNFIGTINTTSGLTSMQVYDLIKERYYQQYNETNNPTIKAHLDAIGLNLKDIYEKQLPEKISKSSILDAKTGEDYNILKDINYAITEDGKLKLWLLKKNISNDNYLENETNEYIELPAAKAISDGIMTKELYESLRVAIEDISYLKNSGGTFIGISFSTYEDLYNWENPTEIPINDGDFTYVLQDEEHLDVNGNPQVCKYIWSVDNENINSEDKLDGLFVSTNNLLLSKFTGFYKNIGLNNFEIPTEVPGIYFGNYYKLDIDDSDTEDDQYLYRCNYEGLNQKWLINNTIIPNTSNVSFLKIDDNDISGIFNTTVWSYDNGSNLQNITIEPKWKKSAFSWKFMFVVQENPYSIGTDKKLGLVKSTENNTNLYEGKINIDELNGTMSVIGWNNFRNEIYDNFPQLDENDKISVDNIPNFILNQMMYGGTFDANNKMLTLTNIAMNKLNMTIDYYYLDFTNEESNNHKGNYYVCNNSGILDNDIEFTSGDLLVSTENGWIKIDNTVRDWIKEELFNFSSTLQNVRLDVLNSITTINNRFENIETKLKIYYEFFTNVYGDKTDDAYELALKMNGGEL